MMGWIAEASQRLKPKIAGVFYLLNILTGASAAVVVGGRFAAYGDAANLLAASCYVVLTLLLYGMFKPVDRSLSFLAALFSLVGCAIGALSAVHLAPSHISPLVFFGFYCLLIGYLIFRSTFLSRILGERKAFGGLGWLAFLLTPLKNDRHPNNMAPGILGEVSLTLWLLVIGVNEQRWKEQAGVRTTF